MAVVEASSSTPAVCRECGSTIGADEPRYGREERGRRSRDPGEPRPVRWRHLACAAQAMPDALLRTLEAGGWRAVPDADRDELRTLIDRARLRAQIQAADVSDASRSMSAAARSSSAMAAAAILEPAHEAQQLPAEVADAWVFADALQARGDVRGELLALELAAEHTTNPLEARTLQHEHRACAARLERTLRGSKSLRLRFVGGFLRGAHPKGRGELEAVLGAPASISLERVRLEFCTQDELAVLVDGARDHACPLSALELAKPRLRTLEPLAGLDALRLLRYGETLEARVLGSLADLRGLALEGHIEGLLASVPMPALELLQLRGPSIRLERLAPLLSGLRWLRLDDLDPEVGLDALAKAAALETLRLPNLALRSLEPLRRLPALRELQIMPGSLALVGELGALTNLERLALHGNKVGELDELRALERCEHLSLSGARTTSLSPLRKLPRLRSLFIAGGDMRRIAGLERLVGLEQLGLAKLSNLDLASLATLDRLDTLVLTPGGRRPRQLQLLAELPSLRRLSIPTSLLAEFEEPERTLAQIEVLELRGGDELDAALIQRLPRLRRLLVPDRDPAELERLAESATQVAIFGELPPRDVLDRRDPFDWRTLGWLPPIARSP